MTMDLMQQPPQAVSAPARRSVHADVSTSLSLLSDDRLAKDVAAAEQLGTGIGGRSAVLEVAGSRVFVKRVPLTGLELRPEHLRSTANLFGLPTYYQYGVGSAGFGAWRELAVHTMTTNWVLADACEAFPLMYHWRVLPDSPPEEFTDFAGGIEGAVAHWEGSGAVRERLEAIGRSTYSLVLFLEYVPHTLGDWLADHGGEAPFLRAADGVARGVDFMASQGLVHFDAHFHNILTDGHRVYFTDFGLALSDRFELGPDEAGFLARHRAYDHGQTMCHLLRNHLPGGGVGAGEVGFAAFLADWIAGERRGDLSPAVADLVDRYAPTALVMDGFYGRLLNETKTTPFPAAALAGLLPALQGLDVVPEGPAL
ncbi:protein kinase family protein [Streptomyces sp. NBC_01465]|uniref:protein kinase family protein n=1 Tax=Streptomyces sp. NBC_01465 TaxID=2903878 RepID=UPI002E2F20D9|nr:protein kinase family protein [Streptomyces sp. NBC_01465]